MKSMMMLVLAVWSFAPAAYAGNFQKYESTSSLIFKPANEVQEGQKTWGLQPETAAQEPQSNIQYFLIGTVVSINPYKGFLVIKDKQNKLKTICADARLLSGFRTGSVVQAMFKPGSSKCEDIKQIVA